MDPFTLADGTQIDLAAPCTVIGGTNGAGKSRLLQRIATERGPNTLLIDLHYLTEHALAVLRTRADYNAMAEEAGPFGPDEARRNDIERIVRRNYESIEWFSLEVELDDKQVADRFRWTGDTPLVPYFRATYRGMGYTSAEMGLGEFSVHFLFWILEQFREERDLLILLDEPDAYLPPLGVGSLLPRLLRLCGEREWRLVITTHSEEMITLAAEHNAFTLLTVNDVGETVATHAYDDSSVLFEVLARSAVDHVLFAEDEVAVAMARALIDTTDPVLARRTTIIWGSGDGDLRVLQERLPRTPRSPIRFAYLYDGDQRDKVPESSEDRWPALFLPSHDDPNTLLMTLSDAPDDLAARLGVTGDRVRRTLDRLEGADLHDWVDNFAAEFGRPVVLQVLATEWASRHPDDATDFVKDLLGGGK